MKSFVAALLATAVMGQTDSCASLKTAWDSAAAGAAKDTAKAAYDLCVSAQKTACDGFQASYNTLKGTSGVTQTQLDASIATAKAAGCTVSAGANALAGSLAAVALAIYATTF